MLPKCLLAIALVGLLLLRVHAQTAQPPKPGPTAAKVTRVIDGDTIEIQADGERIRCQLLGIDAPEMSYARLWTEMDKVTKYASPEGKRELAEAEKAFRTWAKVMEAHARNARDTLATLIQGKTVSLAYDTAGAPRDRYGRLLVYIDLDDLDVNAQLIRQGRVVPETRFPCDRIAQYLNLWRAAQAARQGLWNPSIEPSPVETKDQVPQ